MDTGLVVTFVGIVVAGLAGILGVWMERARFAPQGWALVFTALIVLATGLKGAHSAIQAADDAQTEARMVRVLDRLAVLAATGAHPGLEQLVAAELARQSSANPAVIARLEARAAEKGEDPAALRRRVFEGGRAAAGLPARTRATAAEVGARVEAVRDGASEVRDAIEEVTAPLGVDGARIPKVPGLPEDLDDLEDLLGTDKGGGGKAGKGGKADKGGKGR